MFESFTDLHVYARVPMKNVQAAASYDFFHTFLQGKLMNPWNYWKFFTFAGSQATFAYSKRENDL